MHLPKMQFLSTSSHTKRYLVVSPWFYCFAKTVHYYYRKILAHYNVLTTFHMYIPLCSTFYEHNALHIYITHSNIRLSSTMCHNYKCYSVSKDRFSTITVATCSIVSLHFFDGHYYEALSDAIEFLVILWLYSFFESDLIRFRIYKLQYVNLKFVHMFATLWQFYIILIYQMMWWRCTDIFDIRLDWFVKLSSIPYSNICNGWRRYSKCDMCMISIGVTGTQKTYLNWHFIKFTPRCR